MPVTTTSRRQRRQPTEDIEDASLSQARADEVEDEDEDEAPPRRVRGAKREKMRLGPAEDADNLEVDDPLANFVDQPVDKQQATRISGLAQDWSQARKAYHQSSYALVRDIAASVAEFTDGEKGEKNLAEVDKMMKGLIDTENELLMHEQTLMDLFQQVSRGEAVPEVIARYDDGVQKKGEEYRGKTSRQKYGKHDEYANFRQAIYEVQNPGDAMPPVMDFIPQEEGDDSDDDDDVQVGGVTQDYRCPITLTILVDPLTSDVCKHSFAAVAIRDYFQNSQTSRKECPTAGCNQIISLSNLHPNKELAKKAKEAARRERMREEDDESDDENVI